MKGKPVHCVTKVSPGGRYREIVTDCGVCAAFSPWDTPEDQHPKLRKFDAIWDTGATGSVITQPVVDACGLKPISMTLVHGVGGLTEQEVYMINLMLPNGIGFPNMTVTKAQNLPGAQVLIGMDIITLGDFSITNKDGNTVFSFRYPSIATIDFTKDGGKPATGEKFSKRPLVYKDTSKKRRKKGRY